MTINSSNVRSDKYKFKWKHKGIPYIEDFSELVTHYMTLNFDRWTRSLIRYNWEYYIWAVNLVWFVVYKWEPTVRWMMDFIIRYSPKEIFAKCTPTAFWFYLSYKKKYETASNNRWHS